MRYLRLLVSLALCVSSLLVLLLSVRGVVMFPRTLQGRPAPVGPGGLAPGDMAAVVLVYPLLSLIGVGNACLLGWAGARGLAAVGDPGLWRERQGPALLGLLISGVASLASVIAAPPQSRAVIDLPVSLERGGCLFLVAFGLVGLVSLLTLLLDERAGPEARYAEPERSAAERESAEKNPRVRGPVRNVSCVITGGYPQVERSTKGVEISWQVRSTPRRWKPLWQRRRTASGRYRTP